MCGINGIISNSFSPEVLNHKISLMNDAIIHRGPDSDGILVENKIALGFRRLAIIDLTLTGEQPMESHSERFVIVYNGEIYNFQELKKFLIENYSVSFKGTSDTEILLSLIEKVGLALALEKIDGMFAFALLDRETSCIHLCRDRLGEKPLYFALINEDLFFSSELKPLITLLKSKLTFDKDNINFFIRKSYFPENKSVFKEVQKIQPGTVSTFFIEDNRVKNHKVTDYWNFQTEVEKSEKRLKSDYRESKESLKQLLDEKVQQRMISDVPLGAFLSGGYDSSLIVSLMQKNSMNKVKTFSIGFDVSSYNEAEHSKEIANHLRTDHTELYLSKEDLLKTIEKIPSIYSEPFADPSQIPTILLSELTKTKVTVSLSGDGGDEIFGGYGRYFLGQRVVDTLGRVPFGLRSLIKASNIIKSPLVKGVARTFIAKKVTNFDQKIDKLNHLFDFKNDADLYEKLSSFSNNFLVEDLVQSLYKEDIWSQKKMYAEKAMMQDTIDYLPGDILRKVDLAGMSASLETRIPFLDHEIISLAWSFPYNFKYRNGSGKFILKDVAHDFIPIELLDRPKKGFDIPLKDYLRSDLKDYALSMIDSCRFSLSNIFNFEEIDISFGRHYNGEEDNSNVLWNTISFFAWYNEYFN